MLAERKGAGVVYRNGLESRDLNGSRGFKSHPFRSANIYSLIMHYVYILLLNDRKLYTGITENLKRRFSEHINGKVASTKHKRPIKLIHYESYFLKSDAERRETFLKTTEGKRLLRQQIRDILDKFMN